MQVLIFLSCRISLSFALGGNANASCVALGWISGRGGVCTDDCDAVLVERRSSSWT